MERRELFDSLASSFKKNKKQEIILRPPYFDDESIFLTNCIKCDGICSSVCEENIIIIQDDKTPKLDFLINGCTYCDDCANACPNEVLTIENKKDINARIQINTKECLAWNDTMCFACKDPCFNDAIDFFGMFKPTINDNCTSCGFCVKVCPTQAIKII